MRANTVGTRTGDDVTATLLDMLAELTSHATATHPATGPARIDRIAVLERLRGALAAAQHTEMVAFARDQVEQQITRIETGRLDPATSLIWRRNGRVIAST